MALRVCVYRGYGHVAGFGATRTVTKPSTALARRCVRHSLLRTEAAQCPRAPAPAPPTAVGGAHPAVPRLCPCAPVVPRLCPCAPSVPPQCPGCAPVSMQRPRSAPVLPQCPGCAPAPCAPAPPAAGGSASPVGPAPPAPTGAAPPVPASTAPALLQLNPRDLEFVCQGGVIMITDLILQDHPPPPNPVWSSKIQLAEWTPTTP
jgi:hypothetical protein